MFQHSISNPKLFSRKYFAYTVCLSLVLFLFVPSLAKSGVLMVNSYHRTFPWTDGIVNAIEEVFKNEKIELSIEYLDTKEHPFKEPYINHLRNLFEYKISVDPKTRNDLIIASDDDALNFVLMFYDDLFFGVPVVFTGINDMDIEKKIDRNKMTGVLEIEAIRENIELILRLHPKTKHIVAIYDESSTGEYRWNRLQQYISNYPNIRFERRRGRESLKELENYLSTLGEDSVVLFGSYYYDNSNRYISLSEGVERLTLASKRPIYTTHNQIIRYGTVGGKLLSSTQQGRKAAEMALQILHGESPKNLPVVTEDLTKYKFNYNQLQRFGISMDHLPKGSIIEGQPHNFYERYSKYLWVSIAISSTLLFIILLLLHNIKNQSRANRALFRAANINGLTGLNNRYNLNCWLSTQAKEHAPFLFILLDIDHFAYLNDTFGQDIGDKILQDFADKIKLVIPYPNKVFHMEADCFAIVWFLNDHTKQVSIESIFDRFRCVTVKLNEKESVKLTFSAGCAEFSGNSDAITLFKQAEIALLRARQDGEYHLLHYQPRYALKFEQIAKAKSVISRILEQKGRIPFHFQPIVRCENSRITGYEMLLRLEDQDHHPIFPPIAIIACAQAGYDRELNILSLEAAFEFLDRIDSDLSVNVNFSSGQLLVPTVVKDIKSLAETYRMGLERLVIEVTEEKSLESKQIIKTINEIRDLGVRMALDDFGSGYSSIANMRMLPIDFAKLDKAFLFDPALRQSIPPAVELCKSMGLFVIAEGVEKTEDDQLCQLAGCDYGQGYLFGRPLPADACISQARRAVSGSTAIGQPVAPILMNEGKSIRV